MLHPELKILIDQSLKDKQISVEEKQKIIEKCLELGEDLKNVLEILDESSAEFQKNNLIKCSACGEFIPALERICPSCKYVEDSQGEVAYKLDDLIYDTENHLKSLKSSDRIRFILQILRSSNFSLPIFTASSFILGWNYNSDFLAGAFFTSLIIWILVIRKIRKNHLNSKQNEISFQELLSHFEKNTRLIELYFGNDAKTKDYLLNVKVEIKSIKQKYRKVLIFEFSLYLALLCFLIIIGYLTGR